MSRDIARSYNASTATYRLLRAFNWGPLLMNLGYFRFYGPLAWLNWLTELGFAQIRLARRSIALLQVGDARDVLDVACGRGRTTSMIQHRVPRAKVQGIDLLEENIQVARTVFGGPRGPQYAVGDALALPVEDGSVDRILCLEAAFHFRDRGQFLRECRRALRSEGRLVVVDIVWRTAQDRRQADRDKLQVVREIWQWDDLSTVDDYRAAAAAAGLRLVECHDWTRRVTDPLLTLFGTAAWLGQRRWGRRLLEWINPPSRSIDDNDWAAIQTSARVHRQLSKHLRYVAMAFNPADQRPLADVNGQPAVGEREVQA